MSGIRWDARPDFDRRVLPIETVWDRLRSSALDFGVSRCGSITRLDSLGLHTATAVRRDPIGESNSVCTGKGSTEIAALVGALAEALERYCAEPRGRLEVLTACEEQLDGRFIPVNSFTGVENLTGLFEWCKGWNLRTRDSTWIPANAVFFPYRPATPAPSLFDAHTTGLACGGSLDEALAFAMLECIERDAYSRALALASVGEGDTVPVVSDVAVAQFLPELAATLSEKGMRYLVRDLTCDTAVPTFMCTISDGALSHFGVAARVNARDAVVAAMEEACQSRLTDLQGAREDLADRNLFEPVDRWFLEQGKAKVQDDFPYDTDEPLHQTPSRLAARLIELPHPTDVFYVDLSLSGVDLSVVRVVVPGLEVWAFDHTRIGPRAARWLSGMH